MVVLGIESEGFDKRHIMLNRKCALAGWTKGKASAIEIWVDRNDGNGFVFLIIHTEPNTPDPAPLPPPGTSVVWKYKAIYRYHDEQAGQWSDVVSVTVGGRVLRVIPV